MSEKILSAAAISDDELDAVSGGSGPSIYQYTGTCVFCKARGVPLTRYGTCRNCKDKKNPDRPK